MDRRPEPELMDSTAQTVAYAEADFSESNSLFVEHFLAAFTDLPARGELADLGCGPADICIRLHQRLPGWHRRIGSVRPRSLDYRISCYSARRARQRCRRGPY